MSRLRGYACWQEKFEAEWLFGNQGSFWRLIQNQGQQKIIKNIWEDIVMTQWYAIVQAMRNLNGKATYFQLYEEYEAIIGKVLTPGQKAGIRKKHWEPFIWFNEL